MSKLILPDDLEYHVTLGNIPYFFNALGNNTPDFAGWVADAESGLVRPCTHTQMIDYMYGGEYEERLANEGYDASFEFDVWGDTSEVTEFYIDL